jgi:tol-pal system protein YbgF
MDEAMSKRNHFCAGSLAAIGLACAVFTATPAEAGFFDMFKRNPDTQVPAPTPPGDVAGTTGAGDGQPMMAPAAPSEDAEAPMRMDRIEQQMRTLTGQVEELTYQVRQLQDQLRNQSAGGPAARRQAPAEPAPAAPAPAAAAPADAIGETIGSAGAAPTPTPNPNAAPRNLGQLTVGPGDVAADPQPLDLSSAAAPPAAPRPLAGSSGSPRDDYDAAYDQILKGDYERAEQSFQVFLANYPGDPLDADAQYWIGESLFARGDYRGAADAFLSGYKAYPKSGKAPDMLLKLGLSLSNLGQREAACGTFGEILKKYPKSSNALIQRVKSEQASASC